MTTVCKNCIWQLKRPSMFQWKDATIVHTLFNSILSKRQPIRTEEHKKETRTVTWPHRSRHNVNANVWFTFFLPRTLDWHVSGKPGKGGTGTEENIQWETLLRLRRWWLLTTCHRSTLSWRACSGSGISSADPRSKKKGSLDLIVISNVTNACLT